MILDTVRRLVGPRNRYFALYLFTRNIQRHRDTTMCRWWCSGRIKWGSTDGDETSVDSSVDGQEGQSKRGNWFIALRVLLLTCIRKKSNSSCWGEYECHRWGKPCEIPIDFQQSQTHNFIVKLSLSLFFSVSCAHFFDLSSSSDLSSEWRRVGQSLAEI